MKKQFLLFTSFGILAFVILLSCSQSTGSNSGEEDVVKQKVYNVYKLDSVNPKATWNRILDQKPTKQKVEMFGAVVDVDLGEVKMETSGTAVVKEGILKTTDDSITSATVIFDMASFKLSKEKGKGLFDVKQYPNSNLDMTDFRKDSTLYSAKGNLTIQGVTNPVDIKMEVIKTDKTYQLKGSFTFQTLDFPLRENVTKKDVNKDEIKIKFDLKYIFSESSKK